VTLIGCIEPGGKDGAVVIRGRDVTGTTGTGIGRESGGRGVTTTMGGGDPERNARPATPSEERAATLTPQLESTDDAKLAGRVGQRVLVRGEFEPAGVGHAFDRVKVASIETVATLCTQQ